MQSRLGQTMLMEAAGYTVADQRLIYSAFFSLSLPLLYISMEEFERLMVSILDWPVKCIPDLFRTFNIRQGNRKSSVSLKQVSMDTLTNYIHSVFVMPGCNKYPSKNYTRCSPIPDN